MATLTAAGIGSGIDINGLLEQIIAAERTPTENRLNLKEADLLEEISAYGSVSSALNVFQGTLSSLANSSLYNTKTASIANDDLFSASVTSIAQEASYNIEVEQLATTHSLASVAFSDVTDVIGNGTLKFEFGTTDYISGTDTYNSFTLNPDRSSQSIVIDATNNTVEGVRDAINDADIGVTATVINDGTGYRLLINSDDTGEDNSLRITVDEGGVPADNIDNVGLSQLAFEDNATNLEQTQEAFDASVKINGLQITRETNTVTGAISGVTLNLLASDIGNPTQLTIGVDDKAMTNAIESFVDGYNGLVTTLNDLTSYDAENQRASVLTGDNTTQSILNQIRNVMGGFVDGLSGPYRSLFEIGINTNRDGTLFIDSADLNEAVSNNAQAVGELFAEAGTLTDSAINYISAGSAQPGEYSIVIDSLATQGQLVGDVIAGFPVTVDASNKTVNFSLNNVPFSVTLSEGSYTGSQLAQEIQNRINENGAVQASGSSVTVAFVTDHLELTSNAYGADSKISVTADSADFGLNTSSTTTVGSDVAGSIGGVAATGDGQFLIASGAANGLRLEITGGATGNRGTVNFTQGYSARLDSLISGMLANGGILDTKTDSLNNQVDDIAQQRVELQERIDAVEARYRAQFTALDVLLGQLQTTSNFLQQQLDSLPEIKVSGS